MKTLVVYDFVFGNTEQIARAIAAGMGSQADAKALKIGDVTAEHLNGLGLLIVGSPTRGFRATPALDTFLKGLPPAALKGVKVAAFDTRIDARMIKPAIARFFVSRGGYAAPKLLKLLVQKGGAQAVPPEGFFVLESEGPLRDGELDRAAGWGARLTV